MPKKNQKREPTPRMKIAAKLLAEKGGSKREVFLEAGYSQEIADNPQRVTKTRSWQELMDEYLPADTIAEKHQELLNAEETIFVNGERVASKPNHDIRLRAVDMAHKLRGNYAATKVKLERGISDMTDEELEAIIAEESKSIEK